MNTTTETRKPQPDKLETVLLPHHYTPSERLAMSETQNQALEEIDRLESEASRISKEFTKKIKAQFELVQQIRAELKKGVTERQQEVVTTFARRLARRSISTPPTRASSTRWAART